MTPRAEAPWITNPFGLVSLKEIVALMTGSNDWPTDQIILGPLANAMYGLRALEGGLSPKDVVGVAFFLENAASSLDGWGFAVTSQSFRDLARLVEGHVVQGRTPLHGPETIPMFIAMARQSLMSELAAHVFISVDSSDARYYAEPRRDWEAVIERFPQSVSDIEEAGRCYALRRYAGCVFHCMQVVEHGLLALGTFMGVTDPKSGFTAVSNELTRVLGIKYQDRSDFQRQHYEFFEQINGTVQAMRSAWRNKIDHAQGVAHLMTADFTPHVAMEIYMATRGFMRRLATEMPS